MALLDILKMGPSRSCLLLILIFWSQSKKDRYNMLINLVVQKRVDNYKKNRPKKWYFLHNSVISKEIYLDAI